MCVSFTGIFTVMCYNVLCDKYATRQMYGYCPSWALEWDYRKKGILDEIRHYSADIISLQVSHQLTYCRLNRNVVKSPISGRVRRVTMHMCCQLYYKNGLLKLGD